MESQVNGTQDEHEKSFCEIAGCTGISTSARWVTTERGDQRLVEVCWKHAEGEFDPSLLEKQLET